MNINGKTIAAYILLLIEIAVFFISGYEVAANDARHYVRFPQIPEGMLLTVIKDTVQFAAPGGRRCVGERPFCIESGRHR